MVAHVKIGRVKVIDGTLVSDAGVGSLRPINDEGTEFDVAIDCIVLEFFLFYLFKSNSKLIINPVYEVHNSHRRLDQVDSWLSRYDTQSDYTLHSNQDIVQLLYGNACHVLNQ
jgi:hypothetical protein